MEWLIIPVALFVAFSNGANDNFKGFATVWGSQTLSYQRALGLASLATLLGGLVSLILAQSLVQQFSGKGLVPDAIVHTPVFLLSVASGAAFTVMLATRIGLPVSTTHALIGGLLGAGFAQSSGDINVSKLGSSFLFPMLVSPILASVLGVIAYRVLRLRSVEKDCLCVVVPAIDATPTNNTAVMRAIPNIVVADNVLCQSLDETAPRLSISRAMDRIHILSAAVICFARGVNDTSKLAALLITAQILNTTISIVMIVVAMVVGGLIFSRRVAETMSQRMTHSRLDATEGLAANLITAALVLFASKFGLPVSTTHVSVGSIAGVGVGSNTIDWSTLRHILLSWLATLPLAAAIAWGIAMVI